MMKKISRVFALVLALVMTCSLALLPGFAAGSGSSSGSGSGSGSSVTKVETISVKKIIQSGAGSTLPNDSFTIQMVPATEDEIKAGDNKGVKGGITIQPGLDLATSTVTIDVDASTKLDADGRYSETKTFNITSFKDNKTWTSTGVYQYKISEVVPATAEDGKKDYITYDESVYTLDLYVSKASDGTFYVSGYDFSQSGKTVKPNEISFTNTFAVADLTITKVVYDDLNAGKSFEFSIMIPVGGTKITLKQDEEIAATIYNKDGTVADDTIKIKVNGDDGSSDVATKGTHFFLSDGQYLKIAGAPVGMCYYVKEIDANKDGFTTKWTYTNVGSYLTPTYLEDQTGDQIDAQVNSRENTIVYTNTREVSPNNGISVDVVPYVLVMAIAVAGVAVILLKKRNTSR